MATRIASTAAEGAQPLAIEKGLNTKVIIYDSGTDSFDTSATTVLLAKIPNGARIVDVRELHTTLAATAPMDIGIGVSPAEFLSAGAQGVVNRATKGIMNYKVTIADDAAIQYEYLTAKITPNVATVSVKISVAVDYVADGQ